MAEHFCSQKVLQEDNSIVRVWGNYTVGFY
jgi:hypothetical protein